LTTAERDLAEAIRAELSAIDPPRRCCRLAERAGMGGAFGRRRRTIVRLELRLRRPSSASLAAAAASAGVVAGGHGAAIATAERAQPAERPAIPKNPPPVPDFDWPSSPEHCRTAYLRGLFLAHGSLSLASGRTHLEFVVGAAEAEPLARRLAELDMPASWRIRRGRGVVTWKSAETVGTFLRLVGGGSALLELEARQVSRAVRGDLNRVINAESANLQRAVAAAARELEAIAALEADGRLAEQPYLVRLVADARLEVPEATFSELAERLGIHRSAVQRALERIERLALHPQ
jgi:transcriptional regulator with XRE-family HTH domain